MEELGLDEADDIEGPQILYAYLCIINLKVFEKINFCHVLQKNKIKIFL